MIYPNSTVHHSAVVRYGSTIGRNCDIAALVTINMNCAVMDNVTFHKHSEIGNDCVVHESATIGWNALIGNKCDIGVGAVIGDRAYLGNRVKVLDYVQIGSRAVIKSGAVIRRGEYLHGNNDRYNWDLYKIRNVWQLRFGCVTFPLTSYTAKKIKELCRLHDRSQVKPLTQVVNTCRAFVRGAK